ncbi:MAG: hypothetical protein WA862_13895 [Solirubrobacterales bacterium]
MRRLAKASSAESILGTGSSRGRSDRAFVTLAAARGFKGSGAPSHRFGTLVLALLAAAVCALAIAPGAFASKVVVDSVEDSRTDFGQRTKGGGFSSTVTADAVNAIGSGGVGAGDFYVVDSGSNRIQRFTNSGEWKEAWGFDVVSSGAGNGDAIQSLTVDASGGQFKLSFGGDTTADLPYDATAAQVQSALSALPSIGSGNVTVTGGPGGPGGAVPYGVFFEGSLGGAAQSPIVTSAGTTPLSGGAATATVRTINAGADTDGFENCKVSAGCKAGISSSLGGGFSGAYGIAVQQSTGNLYIANKDNQRVDVFTATGIFIRSFGLDVVSAGKAGDAPAQPAEQSLTVKATGGQFKLSFQGETTADLDFDASAAEVQAALQDLSSVGPQGIAVGGGPGDEAGTTPYLLTFGGALKNSPQPLVVAANGSSPLSGGSATAEVASTQAGATGAEICTDAADCKAGVAGGVAGAFNGPSAVTFAPAGAPNAGNVLITESNGFRVSEFTPAGVFVRAFGFGVVGFGPSKTSGTATAVQSIKIAAANGTFKLSFDGQTTAPLPYNASGEEVRSALNALSTIGGRGGSVAVSGGPGDASGSNPYVVTFSGTLAGTAVGQIGLDASALGLAVGSQATCSVAPTPPDGTTFQWLRNGAPIAGATDETYTFVSADEGKGIQCQASLRFGNTITTQIAAPSVVAPVPTPSVPSPPASIAVPLSTGNLEGLVSRELTCNAGSWGGSPTEYSYEWLRSGQQIVPPTSSASTSDKITISSGEQLAAGVFQCVVTATNASGASTKASGNRHTTPQAQPTPSTPFVTVPALSSVSNVTTGAPGFETCAAASYDVCQAGVSGKEPGQFVAATKIAADGSGNIYVTDGSFLGYRLQYFTQAGATITPQGAFAPDVLKGTESSYRPADVAIGPDNHVFVAQIYKKGETPACIDVEDTPETLIHEFDGSGNLLDTHLECSNNSGGGGPFAGAPQPHALAVNPLTGRIFFFLQTNQVPYVLLIDEADGPHASIGAASDVRGTSATLNAEIEPLKGPWNTYYHFELREAGELNWQRQPAALAFDPVLGNGTGSGSPKACPDGNAPKCEVSFVATGLRPEVEYEVRLMAYTWKGLNVSTSWMGMTFGGHVRATGPNFTTVPSSPTAVTGGASWSSPAATQPSLNLEGELNAANRNSTFVFEYVTDEQLQASGWASASVAPKAPARPVEAGQNFINVEVRQSVANLDPTKTYHYRLVATNVNGVDHGDARVVTPPRDDARFVELISNADGEGMGAARGFGRPFWGVSQDGKRVYFSSQSIGSPESLAGLNPPFGSDRGDDGWNVFQVGNDPDRSLGGYLPGDYMVSSDLSGVIWLGADKENWLSKSPFLSFSPAYGQNEPITQIKVRDVSTARVAAWRMVGGSADFDTFAFMPPQGDTLLPGEITATSTSANYFQITGARSGTPHLSMINQDEDGQQIGAKCGALPGGAGQNAGGELTSRSSISVDGRVIYFGANPAPAAKGVCSFAERNGSRVFKRVDAEETVAVSAPTCTPAPLCGGPAAPDVYRGASLDGSIVVFKTNRRVTPSDQDSTNDVYVYDENPPAGQPKLVQISAGEAVAPSHPTPGTGATTQGVVGISTDGSRIYFVATGRLTAEATAGANNLYVYQRDAAHPAGTLKYLAKFGSGASVLWSNDGSATSVPIHGAGGGEDSWGDGRFLVFDTTEPLLAADTDAQSDVYRIDSEAASDAIVCMSCAGNGEFPADAQGQTDEIFWNTPQVASDDGEVVVFWTEEGLIPADTNGGLDVYAWSHGELELITPKAIPDARPNPSAGTIGDGSVVFFYTAARQVPSDSNSANDVYASRVGGGFPTPEGTFVTCLSGNECKAPPAPVAPPVNPGSASWVGPDNPPPAAAADCRRGFVHKRGKCVRKAQKCKKGQLRKGKRCVKKAPKCKKGQLRKGKKCVKKKVATKGKRPAAQYQVRSGK